MQVIVFLEDLNEIFQKNWEEFQKNEEFFLVFCNFDCMQILLSLTQEDTKSAFVWKVRFCFMQLCIVSKNVKHPVSKAERINDMTLIWIYFLS